MIYANFSCERAGRKETIELWELVLFKANNKGAYIRPLPHVYSFVCKRIFFSDLTYLTPPLRKDRGERVSLPVFFRGGASVNAFFQKRSSRSVDIFAKAGLSFSCSCGRTKMNCDVFE